MDASDPQLPRGWKVWHDPGPPESGGLPTKDSRHERELDRISGATPPPTRRVPVKVLVRLLVQAYHRNSSWLSDFADDVAVIDADLHDVLLAFDNLQRNANGPPTDSDGRAAAA